MINGFVFFCAIQPVMLCSCILEIGESFRFPEPQAIDEIANKTLVVQIIILISIIILCLFFSCFVLNRIYLEKWQCVCLAIVTLQWLRQKNHFPFLSNDPVRQKKNGSIEHMPMWWRMSITSMLPAIFVLFECIFGSWIFHNTHTHAGEHVQYQREGKLHVILDFKWSFTPFEHVSIKFDCSYYWMSHSDTFVSIRNIDENSNKDDLINSECFNFNTMRINK